MEEQVITTLQKLIESGALDNLDQPGAQTFVIYALLIILAILCFRIFIINGWIKKGIERFFTLEEQKVKHLADLNEKVVLVQKLITDEHGRLSDVMRMLQTKRETDLR